MLHHFVELKTKLKQGRQWSRSKTRALYFEIPFLFFKCSECYYTNVTLHLTITVFTCSLTVSLCAAILHPIFSPLVAATEKYSQRKHLHVFFFFFLGQKIFMIISTPSIYFLTIIIKSYKLKLGGFRLERAILNMAGFFNPTFFWIS